MDHDTTCESGRTRPGVAKRYLNTHRFPHLSQYFIAVEIFSVTTYAMENRPKLYAATAFVAGILVTLGYKDFYSGPEWRFWRRRAANRTIAGAGLREDDHINLEDHERDGATDDVVRVAEGIEACIGNTPLFKIKSLSDETGCEILAKAEVKRLNQKP